MARNSSNSTDDGAAADPEQPCQEAGYDACCRYGRNEPDDLFNRNAHRRTSQSAFYQPNASAICRRCHPGGPSSSYIVREMRV
jgi:hypothetical protein